MSRSLEGKKYKIDRSKGLGENDPDMMWLTTMNPETRRLIRVMPEDAARTAQVFDLLLGDNLQGRKDHIAENGCKVSGSGGYFISSRGFPAETYRFGMPKPRGYSLLKREYPPGPLEKRGGISISPRTPLKRTKGRSAPPLWQRPPGTEPASAERSGERRKEQAGQVRYCSPVGAAPANAGTQF